jgi:hypothetical protein
MSETSPAGSKKAMSAIMAATIAFSLLSLYFNKRQVEIIRDRQNEIVRARVKKVLEERARQRKPLAESNPLNDAAAGFRLQILGKPEFKAQVINSLRLILQYDKTMFGEIKRYIYVIERADKTDFAVLDGAPTIMLTDNTAFKSVTWCAGEIARQLFHAERYFYREALKRRLAATPVSGGQPPALTAAQSVMLSDLKDAQTFENMEKDADVFQMRLLRAIGAPRYELDLIQQRKPFDYSLVNDGK